METRTSHRLKLLAIFVVIFLGALALASCSKKVVPETQYIVKDSIVYRDNLVPIEIPADSSAITALIECMGDKAKLTEILQYRPGNNVKPTIKLVNNILTVDCKVDSFAVHKKVRERDYYKSVYEKKVYVKITNELTGGQRWQIRWFWILLSVNVALLAWKYRKKIATLILKVV